MDSLGTADINAMYSCEKDVCYGFTSDTGERICDVT
jgi:hypothetical protein